MTLSPLETERLALLARLKLSEAELRSIRDELSGILDYVDQLAALSTDGVEPLSHPLDLVDVFREDIPEASLDREAALGNAPKRDDDCFLVPAVLSAES